MKSLSRHAAPTWLAGLLAVVLLAPRAGAAGSPSTIRTVCPSGCAYSSVQTAINASLAGDTVRVLAGTYFENITLRAGVSLVGDGPGLSILDGRALGSTILAPTAAIGTSTQVSGFTVRNGRAAAGGGIQLANGASPFIYNNTIEANAATTYFGGGIALLDGSNAIVEQNLIRSNSAPSGGGVFLRGNSNAWFAGNRIEDNSATAGAGVYVQGAGPIFWHNVIGRNAASSQGGGMVLTQGSAATIDTNWFEANTSAGAGGGGGLIVQGGSAAAVRNNVFRNNIANANGGAGGIKLYDAGTPFVDHNRLESNEAYDGGGAYFELGNSALFTDNVLLANRARRFGGALVANNAAAALRNNLLADNEAIQAGGGAYLQAGSPQFSNNTVHNNDRSGPGDGVVVQGASGAVLRENIITSNGIGIHVEQSSPQLIANDVWNNGTNYVNTAPGSGDISQNPRYTDGPLGTYYLSNTAAGQSTMSPAVDAGVRSAAAAGVSGATSRTDNIADSGVVDLGYHFAQETALLEAEPAALLFHSDAAGVALPAQWVLLVAHPPVPLAWTAAEPAGWLTLSSSQGTAPALLTVSVASASLPAGVYDACINVQQGSQLDCVAVRLEIARTCTLAHDLNCNGFVDLGDVILLADHWGETPLAATWVPRFDLNEDGRISAADFVLLTQGWNG